MNIFYYLHLLSIFSYTLYLLKIWSILAMISNQFHVGAGILIALGQYHVFHLKIIKNFL